MHFEVDHRVRYSEVNAEGFLTLDGIVNYLQDTTMLHSQMCGAGLKELAKTGFGWVLSSWQIQIKKPIELYSKIKVLTNPYEFKGFFGYRNFIISSEEGEELVIANSIWVYMDAVKRIPTKITPEAASPYEPLEPKLEMDYAPRKMKLPEGFTALDTLPVHPSQLDTNYHVNNCEYIRTAMYVAGIDKMPDELRAEYKKSAVLGDVFHPYIHRDEHTCIIDLRAEDGSSYATVEFIYKEIL